MAQLISPVALKQFVTLKKDHVTVAFTSHKPTGVWTSVQAEVLFDRDKTVTKLVLCTFLHDPQMAPLPLRKVRGSYTVEDVQIHILFSLAYLAHTAYLLNGIY